MKRLFFITFLSLIHVFSFSQFQLDLLFKNANNLFAQEKYEEAIKQYTFINDKGFESAELYYNMGNAYYKIRNYPRAILNYEKALIINPEDDNIQHNLAKARMLNIDKIDEIPEFVIRRWVNKLIDVLTSNGWALISLGTFIVSLTFFLVFFFGSRIYLKKYGFYLGFVLIIISVTSFYFSYRSKSMAVKSAGAIVMAPTVTIKSSPQDTGTDLFILHEGTKVFIVGKLDNWFEIKLSDGKQGWLQKSAIEPI
jgi:tetratricopeptide (TPR) repeat protein